ncbi:MAG: hypothetical protein J7K26_02285 [Candidatus Aenigmarchaeota archaeon]|nr:hypothetical protein [Candidatus Aenigmarchaeota archaeon]
MAKKNIIKNLSRIAWIKLNSIQKHNRVLSLKVLDMMRAKKSLTGASRELGLDIKIVKSHIKSAIRKYRGRWRPKRFDTIQREMIINSRGKTISIIVTNSKDASLIGRYHNAVKEFLKTGDVKLLKPFKGKVIIDVYGKKHKLETNPDKLFDIAEAREDEEFYTIYGVLNE